MSKRGKDEDVEEKETRGRVKGAGEGDKTRAERKCTKLRRQEDMEEKKRVRRRRNVTRKQREEGGNEEEAER